MDENLNRQRAIEDRLANDYSKPVRYRGLPRKVGNQMVERGQVFRIRLKSSISFSLSNIDSVNVLATRIKDGRMFQINYRELADILYDWELA